MKRAVWSMVASVALVVGSGLAQAEEAKPAQPAMDPAKQAAMEAMQRAGSPGEAHKALKPFAGSWTYTAQWWMSPDAPPQSMTGTAVNTLIFGGRFLKQEFRGQAEGEGQPPFEGVGFTGYDNLRKAYQTVWFDNVATGMMVGSGQFDAAANALTNQGDFSCPLTMETHRLFRSVWTLVDPDHNTFENYMRGPDGREFKAMEIRYSRTAEGNLPCPAGADRC